MLNVTLLGTASIARDGAVLRADLGASGRLLCYYLFEFAGRCHRRERLMDLFWSDLDEEKARGALNTAMWRIRKLLSCDGESHGAHCLSTVGNDVILECPQEVRVDTHEFEKASLGASNQLARGDLTDDEEERLAAGFGAYVGPFLEGDDADWILAERERLHGIFLRSGLELMKVSVHRKEYSRALDFGRRLLAADPFYERAQRDVMLLLLLDGRRAEALHTFRRHKDLLWRELNVEPMPEILRLADEIQSGSVFARLDEHKQTYFGT
jgi:DNA-binding SARP family transcriptional activator